MNPKKLLRTIKIEGDSLKPITRRATGYHATAQIINGRDNEGTTPRLVLSVTPDGVYSLLEKWSQEGRFEYREVARGDINEIGAK